jgi:hypothetical protein
MSIIIIIANMFSFGHKDVKPVAIDESIIIVGAFEAIYIPEGAVAPFVAIPVDDRIFL